MRVLDGLGHDLDATAPLAPRLVAHPAPAQPGFGLDVIHREIVLALVHADFVNGDNVWMLKMGRRPRPRPERLMNSSVANGPGENHFNGDDAVEAHLPRL